MSVTSTATGDPLHRILTSLEGSLQVASPSMDYIYSPKRLFTGRAPCTKSNVSKISVDVEYHVMDSAAQERREERVYVLYIGETVKPQADVFAQANSFIMLDERGVPVGSKPATTNLSI